MNLWDWWRSIRHRPQLVTGADNGRTPDVIAQERALAERQLNLLRQRLLHVEAEVLHDSHRDAT